MFFWNKKEETAKNNNDALMPFGSGQGKPLKFASVEWRDGQQSLLATRIKTEDMLPILSKMDQVGYDSMEMWGGATFDTAIRYLNDDPWERVRLFKQYMKKTPLRMLLRGQNLVGYMQYADDVVEKFVELAAKAGIDIFLVFDGLNDVRNTETAIKAVLKNGKRADANICYTLSPVHTIAKYVEIAKQYAALGVSAIHVEDMAGMVEPNEFFSAVKAIKENVNLPVHAHCHSTGGMADLCYWEAVRAGVEVVDCDVSALALGTSHPPIESIATALKGTCYDPKLDMNLLAEINEYFKQLREKYAQFESKFTGVDIGVLLHQIPGGMMSNLESQLKDMQALPRIKEIFAEVHAVQKDFGYPPLATPFAQMVGSQATFNVLMGQRYKVVSKETADYIKGLYGRPPGQIAPELLKKVLGEKKPFDGRPGSLIAPAWEKTCAELQGKDYVRTEEDVMTYAVFPQLAENFLKHKYGIQA